MRISDWSSDVCSSDLRPGATDVYEVPQNGSYNLNDIDRERINGQAVLQVRPADSLTATLEYTFSQNTVEVRNSNVGIWFNHNDTSSAWTDGPVAGTIFYSEAFGSTEESRGGKGGVRQCRCRGWP